MRSLFCVFVSLLFTAAAALAAEPPAPQAAAPAAPNSLTPEQKASADYYLLMIEMTNASRNTSVVADETPLEDRLAMYYERLVELYCMPEVGKTLRYSGDPTHPACLHYIAQLSARHPNNPVLLCAKHGVDSDLCRNAYAEQYIDSYSMDSLDISEVDLKTKIRAELNEKDIGQLSSEIYTAKSAYEALSAKGEEAKEEAQKKKGSIEDLYGRLLALSCKVVRIKMVHEPVDETKRAATVLRKPRKTDSSLTDLVQQFESIKLNPQDPAPAASLQQGDELLPFEKQAKRQEEPKKVENAWRVRYLTDNCMQRIQEAMEFSPGLPAAVCKLEGETAPNCIEALREAKRRAESQRPVGTRPKAAGFSTF